jgi:cell wall-associated NlpC family hydrolase
MLRIHSRAATVGAIALCALVSACASSGTAPRPFPAPGARPPEGVPPVGAADPGHPLASEAQTRASQIVGRALELQGIPYRNGGSDPAGFDCSGFTQYVFATAGLRLPRETRDQFQLGRDVRPGDQRPGDLVFFSTTAPGASHVGIALGGSRFVHAPSSRGVVRVESMDVSYWSRRLVGIRRLPAD